MLYTMATDDGPERKSTSKLIMYTKAEDREVDEKMRTDVCRGSWLRKGRTEWTRYDRYACVTAGPKSPTSGYGDAVVERERVNDIGLLAKRGRLHYVKILQSTLETMVTIYVARVAQGKLHPHDSTLQSALIVAGGN